MRYRLAIFDFDGTLADSFAFFLRHWNDIADRFGCKRVSAADAAELRQHGSREVLRRVGLPLWKFPSVAREYRRRQAEDPGDIALFPGAAETITRLADAGVVVAIVSSNDEQNIRHILRPELSARVAHYACGASLLGKASKFKTVLKRARIPAVETIAVGDELRDLDASRAAGIAATAVSWGYATPDALRAQRPDHFAESFDELVGTILGH